MAKVMKNSNANWISEIPENWKIVRLKSLFGSGKGLPITKDNLVDVGVAVISYGQIHAKFNTCVHVTPELFRFVSPDYLESNHESLVKYGDFIMADTSEDLTGCGNCAYIDTDETIFAGYHTIILRSLNSQDNKYLAYLFLTDSWRSQIRSKVTGVKLFSISLKILMNTTVLLPPRKEQVKIVNYLDTKCAAIDATIKQTQSSIEEYKRLKQSVITQAVTKGIRGNRPMKDSGVEWIAEIPEEWDIVRIKSLFNSGKGLPITKEDIQDSGVAVISYGQIHAKYNTGTDVKPDLIRYVSPDFLDTNQGSLVKRGDFIVADTSEDLAGSGNCVYIDIDETLFAGYHTIILKSKQSNDNKFLAYLFLTDVWRSQIRSKVTGVKLFSIPLKILMYTTVILPPEYEQQEIVAYLDSKCSVIDEIIAKKENLIVELESYKKSLIYEYVTGKKEVC